MSPVEAWLNANTEGYAHLVPDERQAIHEFSLLWSFFEARVMANNASIGGFRARVAQAANHGSGLDVGPFQEALAFFTARYRDGSGFNHRFQALRFHPGPNGGRTEVEAVSSEAQTGAAETILALLIIVYRLRNNLFHGEKWSYYFKDQLGNFTHASAILMRTVELFAVKGLLTVPE